MLRAVDGIDFDVRRGEAFGFLGPNGAGKSSTMRMVGCVSPISGGSLEVLDMDPAMVIGRMAAARGACRSGRLSMSAMGRIPAIGSLENGNAMATAPTSLPSM